MADKSEEEYLNDLLKELLESTDDSGENSESNSDNTIENMTAENEADDVKAGEFMSEESEDEDMAMLSRMLSDDSNLPDEESEETDLSDVNMDLSIDDLLNEALVENNQEEPEITPIFSENNNEFQDLVLDDSVPETAASEVSEETASEIVDEFGSDFFSDLQGLISSGSSESTKVDENAFRQSIMEEETKQATAKEDFSDLFSLDEGMTIDDIPDEHEDEKLTEEELSKISGLTSENDAESDANEEQTDKRSKKKREKKEKKRREKKEKKAREPKVPKKEKKSSADKPKEKKSFKEFISLFDDEDSDNSDSKADNNQELINELYNDKEIEEAKEKKPKKAKKVKAPKEKKKKAPKVKKEPEANEPVEKVYLGKAGVAIITVLVLVFLVGGYFGVSYLNYRLTINTAKNYYNIRNYTMAYEELAGIDIKARDEYFYEQVRLLMIVNQGNDSYNNYMKLDMEAEAVDALINAVGRKQLIEEQAEKYNVTDKVNVVYQQLLETLDKYGIDEARALDLYRMTDYEAYYAELARLGGVTQ